MSTRPERPEPPVRSTFPVHRSVPTRWDDHDHYGHVNNAVYYSYFDTAVNGWLIEASGVDVRVLPQIGLVVETSCRYLREVNYPDALTVGLRVEHLGTSSVRYDLALFRDDEGPEASAVAVGRFVHVYVDAGTRTPTPVPPRLRELVGSARGAGVT